MTYEIAKGSATFKMGISNPAQLTQWLDDNPNIKGLSFVGRSNVGKSSLINTLFGKSTARVSKTPGRTREINIFTFELLDNGKKNPDLPLFYLFDLPGYGFAKVSKNMSSNWNELASIFFGSATEKIRMVNLQDARHPNQKVDKEFHRFLKNYNFETTLVFNKIDKLKTQKERAQLQKIKASLYKEYKWVRQIFFVSAEDKSGIPQLHDSLIYFLVDDFNN